MHLPIPVLIMWTQPKARGRISGHALFHAAITMGLIGGRLFRWKPETYSTMQTLQAMKCFHKHFTSNDRQSILIEALVAGFCEVICKWMKWILLSIFTYNLFGVGDSIPYLLALFYIYNVNNTYYGLYIYIV